MTILVNDSGRQTRPRVDSTPITATISSSGDNTVSAAVGGGQRRAIYKWQGQAAEDGHQIALLKVGGTEVDGAVAALDAQGKIEPNCWIEVEPDEAIEINLAAALDSRYFVWVTNT